MNYLESNPKIPWDDLKYIFGEIMYPPVSVFRDFWGLQALWRLV